MDAAEFRRRICETFGQDLERANPENVREFVTWFLDTESGRRPGEHYELSGEPDASVEAGLKAFLLDALTAAPEPARQQLWVALLEIWYGVLETDAEARFERIFRDIPSPDEPSPGRDA